jgi:hypothetical protein
MKRRDFLNALGIGTAAAAIPATIAVKNMDLLTDDEAPNRQAFEKSTNEFAPITREAWDDIVTWHGPIRVGDELTIIDGVLVRRGVADPLVAVVESCDHQQDIIWLRFVGESETKKEELEKRYDDFAKKLGIDEGQMG